MRINKFFTEHGITSRREADKFIQEGRVAINGQTAKLGDQVKENDVVTLDGRVVPERPKKEVILAYNKPAGVVCTTDRREPDNIVDAIGYPERIFNIGRLDQFSEGLILLTNMGDIVNRILRSRYGQEKEYIVDLNGNIDDASIQLMRNGLVILGRKTLPCVVERLGPRRIRMILTEGRNRQIRRMVEEVGLRVSRLRRVRIMHIALGTLQPGEWRKLTNPEKQELFKSFEKSEQIARAAEVPFVNFEEDDDSYEE